MTTTTFTTEDRSATRDRTPRRPRARRTAAFAVAALLAASGVGAAAVVAFDNNDEPRSTRSETVIPFTPLDRPGTNPQPAPSD